MKKLSLPHKLLSCSLLLGCLLFSCQTQASASKEEEAASASSSSSSSSASSKAVNVSSASSEVLSEILRVLGGDNPKKISALIVTPQQIALCLESPLLEPLVRDMQIDAQIAALQIDLDKDVLPHPPADLKNLLYSIDDHDRTRELRCIFHSINFSDYKKRRFQRLMLKVMDPRQLHIASRSKPYGQERAAALMAMACEAGHEISLKVAISLSKDKKTEKQRLEAELEAKKKQKGLIRKYVDLYQLTLYPLPWSLDGWFEKYSCTQSGLLQQLKRKLLQQQEKEAREMGLDLSGHINRRIYFELKEYGKVHGRTDVPDLLKRLQTEDPYAYHYIQAIGHWLGDYGFEKSPEKAIQIMRKHKITL